MSYEHYKPKHYFSVLTENNLIACSIFGLWSLILMGWRVIQFAMHQSVQVCVAFYWHWLQNITLFHFFKKDEINVATRLSALVDASRLIA